MVCSSKLFNLFCNKPLVLVLPTSLSGEQPDPPEERPADIWKNRPQLLKDYIRILRDRTPYFETSAAIHQRSNQDYESVWQTKLQLQFSSRQFYYAEGEQWSYYQEDPFSPVDKTGSKTTIKLGFRQETEEASVVEVLIVNHMPNTGLEGRYSDYWEPWNWEIQGAYQSPWQSTIVSRVLGGTVHRGRLLANRVWNQGRWSFDTETTLSRYLLSEEPSFQTMEQTQEIVVTRSWFGDLNFAVSYSIVRGLVQHPQPPVIVPDRLNHALLGSVEHEPISDFVIHLETTYEARLVSHTEATRFRGEVQYEPTNKQRYWLHYQTGTSDQIQEIQETRLQAGIRLNW